MAQEQMLQVDYEGLDGVVSQLNQMHDQANNIKNNLQNKTEECRSGKWKGKGADAYYREYEEIILPAVDRLIEGTQQASEKIKRMKGETKTLEEELQSAWNEMINQIPGF